MQNDPSPIFRRTAAPWYDSDTACILVAVFVFIVFLFGIAGIRAAAAEPPSRQFIGIPVLLLVLSAVVLISTIVRLIRRKVRRY